MFAVEVTLFRSAMSLIASMELLLLPPSEELWLSNTSVTGDESWAVPLTTRLEGMVSSRGYQINF